MPVQHLLACACKGRFLMQHGIHVSGTTPAIPVLYIQGVKAALLCQLTASVALPLHLMSSNKPQPCIPSSPAALSASPSCMPPPQYFFPSRLYLLDFAFFGAWTSREGVAGGGVPAEGAQNLRCLVGTLHKQAHLHSSAGGLGGGPRGQNGPPARHLLL